MDHRSVQLGASTYPVEIRLQSEAEEKIVYVTRRHTRGRRALYPRCGDTGYGRSGPCGSDGKPKASLMCELCRASQSSEPVPAARASGVWSAEPDSGCTGRRGRGRYLHCRRVPRLCDL